MKNILYQESIVEIKHLFRVMKITALALFLFVGTAFATKSYSQTMKVTVVSDRISTGKVIILLCPCRFNAILHILCLQYYGKPFIVRLLYCFKHIGVQP